MANSRTPRLIGRVVKISLLILVLLVNGVLIFRLCSSGDPASMNVLIANDPLRAAYAVHGDDLVLQYQNHPTITRAEHNSGYFSVTQYVFIPQADQVQLVFRYNNSTIRHLQEDYGLESLPSKEEHLFDVTLIKTVDLTPDDKTDNTDPATLQTERIWPTPACTIEDRTSNSLYTYYRYVFDGVTFEDAVGIFADVYYMEDIQGDYENDPYGTLCLYDATSSWITQKLTDADKRALQ